jgi:hypothetical protein
VIVTGTQIRAKPQNKSLLEMDEITLSIILIFDRFPPDFAGEKYHMQVLSWKDAIEFQASLANFAPSQISKDLSNSHVFKDLKF